jgi:hypothetical protein
MKKHIIYFLMLLPAVFIASGCQKYEVGNPPASTVANFTYSATNSSKAPCVVTFTNTSLNAAGYLWDFGNGQTSTETNPVVAFDTFGQFTVTLTCTAVNDVYYNQLVKTMVINIKDPNAGLTQVLYYTTRGPVNGGVHMVILDGNAPVIADFASVPLSRPYGITADTAHSKVYVSDFTNNVIYRFDADGTNPVKILDNTMSELCNTPEALMVKGDKLYWGSPGGIFRCDLDGKNPEIYNPGLEFPIDMQYDPKTDMIYLVNEYLPEENHNGGYFTLNFDGTNLQEPIKDVDGTAIEVNTLTGKVYIAAYNDYGPTMPDLAIYSCNVDGTSVSKIGDLGTKATWGIAIDNKRNKVFWGYKISNTAPDGKIIRANLDGTGAEDWIKNTNPQAMQAVWIKL